MWTFFLSIKYFFSKRKEGMISLISGISASGVALGVAALIIVLSVMNGFDSEVKNKIIGTYAHVIIMREDGITDYNSLVSQIEAVPEVENASVFVTGQAIIKKDEAISGIILKGIDPQKESEVTKLINYAGESGGKLGPGTLILGKELLRNENIDIGDIVEIFVPYSAIDFKRIKVKVVGTFNSGRYDYDANMALVDVETAQEIFRLNNAVTGIGVKLADADNAYEIKKRFQNMLGYPYMVKTWMDLDRNLVSALALEKKMMFVILGLIIIVACFNISGSLIMMVMEKTRDIGILKAIGANTRGISLVFILQGMLIGVSGVTLGSVAGLYIANRINIVSNFIEKITGVAVFPSDVYYFTEIPVQIKSSDIFLIISIALFLSIAAGIYPAWKASRLDPVEAIRYE
ncbi:MAG: lipoprotein-releasing ABC transporter permease subunit [Candidatus Omnitrophota bacterium]